MSGHFATLLRGTVETFLPDHDVYITDWQDARDMPLSAGRFDLDDYIDMMADMFRFFGGDVHVFAVCQPSVPVLAATALMEADGDPCVPLSLILAGGPIDTRINPDRGQHAGRGARHRLVPPQRHHQRAVVRARATAGRSIPGFLQLSGFMTMNLDRHMQAHKDMFQHLVRGDGDSAEKHREFYDEYLAVMDLTAEFYLQTVDTVFVQHLMPRGLMTHRGRPVDLDGDHAPCLDDHRGREGRHHRHRPVQRRTRSVCECCSGAQKPLRVSQGRTLRHFQRRALPFRDRAAHGEVHARARSLRQHQPQHCAARAHGDDAATRPQAAAGAR